MKKTEEYLEKYASVPGWLYKGAMELSEIVLKVQSDLGVEGVGTEIGVFHGKYLSFLALCSDIEWTGIDVFLFDQQENVETNLNAAGVKSRVHLVKANSRTLSADDLPGILNCDRIAFASIDGDHSSDGVIHDLEIVSARLANGGVIALDDFCSGTAPAVMEGFFEFCRTDKSLRPFAYSDNKLFLTTKGFEELYQIRIRAAISNDQGICGQRWRQGPASKIRPLLGGNIYSL